MKDIVRQVEQVTVTMASDVLETTGNVTSEVTKTLDTYVAPARTSVLKRFPVIFSLLVTFGVATTYYAFEKILSQYEILNQYPWLILMLGLSVLAFTGTLYKKIG
jgi:uncharacterized integral membrane protein